MIDPHRDLAEAVQQSVPSARTNDVILSTLKQLYGDSWDHAWSTFSAAEPRNQDALPTQESEERVKEVPRRTVGRLHQEQRGMKIFTGG